MDDWNLLPKTINWASEFVCHWQPGEEGAQKKLDYFINNHFFNPVLQGEKFDPQGEYIRRWVPELKNVSNKWIHKPWRAPNGVLPLSLGIDYPSLGQQAELRLSYPSY